MQRYDSASVSAGDASRAAEPSAVLHITHFAHSSTAADTRLLAEIPDLTAEDPESLVEEHTAAQDGRLLSQALASKLVLGGGILLALAAILPFCFLKKAEPKPANDQLSAWNPAPPAPNADTAPSWNRPMMQKPDVVRNAAGPSTATNVPASIVVPALPERPGNNVTAPALTGNTPEPSGGKSTPPTLNGPALPTMPVEMPTTRMSSRPVRPGSDRMASPVSMNQPMTIGNAPQGGYPQTGYPPVDSRPAEASGARPFYQADTRGYYHNSDRGNSRVDYRSDYPQNNASQVNPLMPDLNKELAPQGSQTPPSSDGLRAAPPSAPAMTPSAPGYPSSAVEGSSRQAGVAQIQGIIATPSTQDHP